MKLLGISMLFLAATALWPNSAPAQASRAPRAAQVAPRGGQSENRWRYVWHNDRWWYWTTDEHWSTFDGRRWVRYDPRQPSPGALAGGYRKAPAFETPPAAPPQSPRSWPSAGVEAEAAIVNQFDLEGGSIGLSLGGGPLPAFGETSVTQGGIRASERMGTTASKSAPTTGGGAFGGPKGGSLGAGSGPGGASSPR